MVPARIRRKAYPCSESKRNNKARNRSTWILITFLVAGVIIFLCEILFESAPLFAEPSSYSSLRVSTEPEASGMPYASYISTKESARTSAESTTTTTTTVTYPLSHLNLSSATEFYQRGFSQRMKPVPLERWEAVANTTCIRGSGQSSEGGPAAIPDWQKRVPYVVLIGAQKGGTTALAYYLYNHPSIQYLPDKELCYFDEILDQNPSLIATEQGGGIPATLALEYFQQAVVGGIMPMTRFQSEVKYILDATPNYLFASDRVPHRLFCVAPWVKLVAVLRNPVDRAYSQYHMQFNRDLAHPEQRRGFVTFEEYVELDLAVLREIGVIGSDNTPLTSNENEQKAWQRYTKLGTNSPIGKGMYPLQLRQWLHTMDLYGKPHSDLWIVPSSQLLQSTNETYAGLIQFLELEPHQLVRYGKIHETKYRTPRMTPEVRAKLEAFYAPYNRQLEGLLGSRWARMWVS